MRPFLRVLALGLAMTVIGATTDAPAQAPAPAAIEGPIYSVTYVEVMPTSRTDGIASLKRYRDAARKEDGNLRCEVVSRIGQPHQLAILEVWKDQKAFEAHGKSANTTQLRDKIQAHEFDIGKGDPLRLTVSIGVADFPEAKVETAEDLLDCADRALYRAKAGGRNLVCV